MVAGASRRWAIGILIAIAIAIVLLYIVLPLAVYMVFSVSDDKKTRHTTYDVMPRLGPLGVALWGKTTTALGTKPNSLSYYMTQSEGWRRLPPSYVLGAIPLPAESVGVGVYRYFIQRESDGALTFLELSADGEVGKWTATRITTSSFPPPPSK